MMPDASTKGPRGRDTLAEQARRLLEGKERWQPTWQAVQAKKNSVPEHDPMSPPDTPRPVPIDKALGN